MPDVFDPDMRRGWDRAGEIAHEHHDIIEASKKTGMIDDRCRRSLLFGERMTDEILALGRLPENPSKDETLAKYRGIIEIILRLHREIAGN